MGNFRNLQPSNTRPGSVATGRPGLRESAKIDFDKPAFGSVQVGEGKFFWCAFRRLGDWMDGGEPLDSGFHASEGKTHASARAAVRYLLNEREQLAPMPDSWVLSYYQRLMDRELLQEQVERYTLLLEREDGTIAGYEWEAICEENDYALVGFDVDEDDAINEDFDEDEAEAA